MRTTVVLFVIGCGACGDPELHHIPEASDEPCVLEPAIVQRPASLSIRARMNTPFTVLVAEVSGGCEDLVVDMVEVALYASDFGAYQRTSLCEVCKCDRAFAGHLQDGTTMPLVLRDSAVLDGTFGLRYRKDEDPGVYTITAKAMASITVSLTPRADAPLRTFVLMLENLTLTKDDRGVTEHYEFTPVLGSQISIEDAQ